MSIGTSYVVERVVDVGGELGRLEVPWVHTIGDLVVAVDGEHGREVGDVVAAAGQLVTVLDGDGQVVADAAMVASRPVSPTKPGS